MDPVVEVSVCLADTTIDIVHVLPGTRCIAGRAPDARIALDVEPFAVVEWIEGAGFVARGSAGAQAISLERDVPRWYQLGRVAIRIELRTHTRTPVPRARLERRPYVFGAGSLLAHVGTVLLAGWLAAPPDETVPAYEDSRRRPARIARFAVEAQTTRRAPDPPPVDAPITVDDTPSDRPKLDEPAAGAMPSIELHQTPNGAGQKVAATPHSTERPGEKVSSPRSFDPDASPAFDTIKVGDYTTVSTGKAAGEHYELAGANGKRKPLIVVSCDSASCVVIGGDAANDVRRALEAALPAIVGCYAEHGTSAGKKVELDFGIDDRGKVDTVSVGGVGDYDSCVANIINDLDLGEPAATTR